MRTTRTAQRWPSTIGQGELHLAVRDDGQVPTSPAQPPEGGNGLLGMRERVAVYGG